MAVYEDVERLIPSWPRESCLVEECVRIIVMQPPYLELAERRRREEQEARDEHHQRA